MQDYKRIVSYIHTYENNEKKRNIGFAKLEARGRLGRLAILLNGLNMLEGRKIAVYFLNIADYQEGIQVGECRVDKGRVAAELRFDTESIADSNMNLEQMQGLYFMAEEEPYAVFASSWTDERIIPDKFRVRGRENAGDNAEESIRSNTGYNSEDSMQDSNEADDGDNTQDSEGDGTAPEVLRAAVIEAAPKKTGDDETFKAFLEALRNMDSVSEAEIGRAHV